MPTYDYECRGCGHRFELFQSMTAKVKRKCPECGEPKLQRLIGAGAGILFKGDGFYQTDYRSDSYRSGQKKAEEKPADTKSAGESKGGDAGTGGSKGSKSGSD